MTRYQKAAAIADILTTDLRLAPRQLDLPKRSVSAKDVLRGCKNEKELDFYYRGVTIDINYRKEENK